MGLNPNARKSGIYKRRSVDWKLLRGNIRGRGDSGYVNLKGILPKPVQGEQTSPGRWWRMKNLIGHGVIKCGKWEMLAELTSKIWIWSELITDSVISLINGFYSTNIFLSTYFCVRLYARSYGHNINEIQWLISL